MSSVWDQLWFVKCLFTSCESQSVLKDAAIAVQDGKIAWLGPAAQIAAPEQQAKQCHYFPSSCLTAGFIDCHTHLVYAGQRASEFEQRLTGGSYQAILAEGGGIHSTVVTTRAASEAELYQQSAKRLRILLKEGVTCVEIKSGYGLDVENELKMLRVARRLAHDFPVTIKTSLLSAHVLPPEYAKQADAYIEYIGEIIMPAALQEGLIDAVDAFCEAIAFSPMQIESLLQKAKQLGLPVKLHAEQLSNSGGARLAAKYHALSADHLEYADEESIAALAAAGVVATLLPGAFYFLNADKKPNVALLRQYQVPIAIATDANPGSSPCHSLLLMLNMACVLFGLTAHEALMAVTINAAKALGLETTHGSLEVGKVADFCIWDVENPVELAYWIGGNPCQQIIKQGKIVRTIHE